METRHAAAHARTLGHCRKEIRSTTPGRRFGGACRRWTGHRLGGKTRGACLVPAVNVVPRGPARKRAVSALGALRELAEDLVGVLAQGGRIAPDGKAAAAEAQR